MNTKTRKLTLIAMFCAIAYVVMVVARIPVVLFLKYEPKEMCIRDSAETGHDVFVFIQLFIQVGAVDLHVGMGFSEGFEALGSSDDAEELDVFDAFVDVYKRQP